ncbi:hypothetical protein [Spirosoma endophyticum]|uniref:Type II CBASS E2 protein domain-containing protein n=1 Tax=Spirosoma endophyticum TaxID=662367 RepID=A0A1I2B7K8_9BACT|nr:hypothetical protein [Spirosoma endophyticum]SFE52182.1 hypothetical protein SAMN05216167_11517 [Spirosoma endophyticum]
MIPGEINRDSSAFELFIQRQLLDEYWPTCRVEQLINNQKQQFLKVDFTVKQPYFTTSYQIELRYLSQEIHRVWIRNRKIKPSLAIHMYSDRALCLYYPADISPFRRLWIATDLIPLAAKWVGHYEEWLFNGHKWPGIEAPGHDFLMQRLQYREQHQFQQLVQNHSLS